jgi:hypothetical protein
MNAVVYAIGEAWRSMWRRRGESLMAVLTASASLFVLGLLLLAGASASNLLERWSAAAEFSVFLADGATPGERAAIERTLAAAAWSPARPSCRPRKPAPLLPPVSRPRRGRRVVVGQPAAVFL